MLERRLPSRRPTQEKLSPAAGAAPRSLGAFRGAPSAVQMAKRLPSSAGAWEPGSVVLLSRSVGHCRRSATAGGLKSVRTVCSSSFSKSSRSLSLCSEVDLSSRPGKTSSLQYCPFPHPLSLPLSPFLRLMSPEQSMDFGRQPWFWSQLRVSLCRDTGEPREA